MRWFREFISIDDIIFFSIFFRKMFRITYSKKKSIKSRVSCLKFEISKKKMKISNYENWWLASIMYTQYTGLRQQNTMKNWRKHKNNFTNNFLGWNWKNAKCDSARDSIETERLRSETINFELATSSRSISFFFFFERILKLLIVSWLFRSQ